MIQTRFATRLIVVLIILICAAAVQTAASAGTRPSHNAQDTMTDVEAAKLLKDHEMFGIKTTIVLNTGTIHASLSDVERYQQTYTAFRSLGLVELTSVEIEGRDKRSGICELSAQL